MAIVEGQKIKVKWGTLNKRWFEDKGYEYTGISSDLYVNVEDLMKTSMVTIEYYCDECGIKDTVSNRHYHRLIENNHPLLCGDCSYGSRSNKKLTKLVSDNKKFKEKRLEIYKSVINGELKEFPDGYISQIALDETAVLVKHMVSLMLINKDIDNTDELPRKIRDKHFKKYKLNRLLQKFELIEMIQVAYPNRWDIFEFHQLPKGFWKNNNNHKKAIEYLYGKLKEEGVVKDFSDMPKKLTRKVFYDNKMGSLFKYYNGVSDIIMTLYPNQFKEWEFNVTKGYYSSDDNKRKVLEWFIKQLHEDGKIKTIDDIPKVVSNRVFREYKVNSMFKNGFNSSTYSAMNFMFPNKWKPWEFKNVRNGFWDDANNVREAIIWLVNQCKSQNIIQSVSDLSNKNLRLLFKEFRLPVLYDRYDIPFLLSMIYGGEFKYKNKIVSKIDKQRLDSYEELKVHNIIATNFTNYVKGSQSIKLSFNNAKEKEMYIPDWIIGNTLIVEYFGLYKEGNDSEYIKEYCNKTKRKIEYYNSLKDYNFIELYPEDLHDNYQGLIKKFQEYGYQIELEQV